jgi:hypothetical protein
LLNRNLGGKLRLLFATFAKFPLLVTAFVCIQIERSKTGRKLLEVVLPKFHLKSKRSWLKPGRKIAIAFCYLCKQQINLPETG